MKKGLSVLLVAAALFGFYGGAVNLNDILACKDYWEEAGEKSTADMNKLEDGLNQLKDNEQAYLDGLDQVAQGEKDLAQGEADYAAGQAELAKGEADYAAAPGKLADARKQIAQGEKDLAAGKKKLDDGETAKSGLNQLIKGLDQIINGYSNTWKPGFKKLQDGRTKFSKTLGAMKGTDSDPYQLAKFAVAEGVGDFTEDYTGALDNIISDEYGQNQKGYDDYIKNIDKVIELCPKLEMIRQGTVAKLGTTANGLTALKDRAESDELPDSDLNDDNVIDEQDTAKAQENAKSTYCKSVSDNTDLLKSLADGNENEEALLAAIDAVAKGNYNTTYAKYINSLVSGAYDKAVDAKESIETLQGTFASTKTSLEDGIENLNNGQTDMATGARTISSAILGNDTLKEAVQKNMGNSGIALLNALKTNPGLMDTVAGSLEDFQKKMESEPYNLLTNLKTARGYLAAAVRAAQDALDKGYDDYNEGKAKLKAGKEQYRQGLADYKAAPGKLADGRQQLAEGLQALMDGRAQLAAGKDQLAQYEDGEQQVRDGLATLVGTEADLDLESILDRLNGDDDFDNGDEHLDIDEGLAAVDVGRGYQAEDGVLITKEIMTRAIGTGGLLAAGVLAVLAAILSFMKKNKGAGVFAILSAVAGAFGAFEATQAGTYFSSIAGSTVGQTGMIAAGILAAVALVHSIVHFTAKKEA